MDAIKRNSLLIIGVPEGEEKEKGAECKFKGIVVEYSPNMAKGTSKFVKVIGYLTISVENYLFKAHCNKTVKNQIQHLKSNKKKIVQIRKLP